MRGEILSVDGISGDGLISGEDGVRYSFIASASRMAVYPGNQVEFEAANEVATRIVNLNTPPRIDRTYGYHRPPSDPLPGTAWGYVIRCLKKYVDGNGRALRREYWWFVLFRVLVVGAPLLIGGVMSGMWGETGGTGSILGSIFLVLGALVYVGTILPNLCAMIRRFHDVGLTGWLVLLNAIPYVGGLITLVISLLPSEARTNKHGPVPGAAARTTAEVFS